MITCFDSPKGGLESAGAKHRRQTRHGMNSLLEINSSYTVALSNQLNTLCSRFS